MIDVCDIQVMKPLLAEHGFHFSKAKGQNFLIARWVPEQIAADSGVDSTVGVLEIGPGIGPLTQQLALRAGKVCAVELDRRLEPILRQTVGGFSNLEILWGDVLKQDVPALVAEKFAGLRPMACANLPYYITSPILTALLEAQCFEAVTVMVQKEVAQRLCAKAGDKDYGAFSILTRWYAEPELLFTVAPGCFVPQPKVQSAVVHMKMRKVPPVETDEKAFFAVVRAAFNQRRKTLVNALGGLCGKEKAAAAIEACGFPPAVRGEALTLEDFAALTEKLST